MWKASITAKRARKEGRKPKNAENEGREEKRREHKAENTEKCKEIYCL